MLWNCTYILNYMLQLEGGCELSPKPHSGITVSFCNNVTIIWKEYILQYYAMANIYTLMNSTKPVL